MIPENVYQQILIWDQEASQEKPLPKKSKRSMPREDPLYDQDWYQNESRDRKKKKTPAPVAKPDFDYAKNETQLFADDEDDDMF